MSSEVAFRVVLALLFLSFSGVWLRGALRAGLSRRFLYASRESLGFALLIRVLVLELWQERKQGFPIPKIYYCPPYNNQQSLLEVLPRQDKVEYYNQQLVDKFLPCIQI